MRYRHACFVAAISLGLVAVLGTASRADAGELRFSLEIEAGPVWQSSNDVQIPNSELGTRFSLADLAGNGPWPAGRLYLTWNLSDRHGLRLLLAPFSSTETGVLDSDVDFAGATYAAGVPIEAGYTFNSWRVSYRYKFKDGERWRLWVGFTAKIRDAEIELRQGDTASSDDDLGFVPLAHFAAEYRLTDRWRVMADLDALAGGPGRAIDLALKVGYDLGESWAVTAGYRTLEGGADTDDIYNFAWFNYAVVSALYRF